MGSIDHSYEDLDSDWNFEFETRELETQPTSGFGARTKPRGKYLVALSY
jgi:hypothetical protein